VCKRMLDCVKWCMAKYPGHNLLCVGHLHLVASQLRTWGDDSRTARDWYSTTRVGFAAFASWVDRGPTTTQRWYWQGIPHDNARGKRVRRSSLAPVVKSSPSSGTSNRLSRHKAHRRLTRTRR
jgi:hypothetical protein